MYQELIKKYIPYLTIHHVKEYARSKKIMLSDEESRIIYQFIKDHSLELLEDDTTIFLLKGKIREDLFEQVYFLYQEKKTKYL